MNPSVQSLDLLQVASPCTASWDAMQGDHRVRFCRQCRLNVYNLSELTRTEAENLIQTREGRTCVRFFRRADGTVLTRDCPVGLRGVRQRFARAVAALAGMLLAMLSGTLLASRLKQAYPDAFRCESPIFARWIQPEPDVYPLLGDVALPISAPASPTGPAQSPQESAP